MIRASEPIKEVCPVRYQANTMHFYDHFSNINIGGMCRNPTKINTKKPIHNSGQHEQWFQARASNAAERSIEGQAFRRMEPFD